MPGVGTGQGQEDISSSIRFPGCQYLVFLLKSTVWKENIESLRVLFVLKIKSFESMLS